MSSLHTIQIMLLQIFVLFLFRFNPSSATKNVQATDDQLRDLCIKTSDYYFCKVTFRMWDGIEHANTYELANVATLSATIQARLNKYVVNAFIQSGQYEAAKPELEKCYGNFIVTAGKLEEAYKFSDDKDCKNAKEMLKGALLAARDCDSSFERLSDEIPNPIDMYSFDLMTRCYTALVTMNQVCKD